MPSQGSNPCLSVKGFKLIWKEIAVNQINVMLVDDHKLFREALRMGIEKCEGMSVIADVDSGEECLNLIQRKKPDIVLMDVQMPGIGGLEATKRCQRLCPTAKVIVVTVCDDELFPPRLLQAGAYGYVTKGASLSEIELAVRQVYKGQKYLSQEIARQMALKTLDNDRNIMVFNNLSGRELQVCLMIVKGEKVQTIADDLCLSPKTVNSYRYRIFEKLDVQNDVELTLLAIKHKLIDASLLTE